MQKGKSIIKYYLNNISEFDIFQMLSVFVNLILSPVVFLVLLVTFISRIVNLDSKNLILGSFILLPPLSWFILAKGHSYITAYQLTFFIWYIPTIAYILASVLSKEKIITWNKTYSLFKHPILLTWKVNSNRYNSGRNNW